MKTRKRIKSLERRIAQLEVAVALLESRSPSAALQLVLDLKRAGLLSEYPSHIVNMPGNRVVI